MSSIRCKKCNTYHNKNDKICIKKCEKCGAEHAKPGISCSRKCANSRVPSKETKEKTRQSMLKFEKSDKGKALRDKLININIGSTYNRTVAYYQTELCKANNIILFYRTKCKCNICNSVLKENDINKIWRAYNNKYIIDSHKYISTIDKTILCISCFDKLPLKYYKGIKINGIAMDEHRYLMEQKIGRKLNYNEVVHHIDCNKHNNKLENLQLMSRIDHVKLHHKLKNIN